MKDNTNIAAVFCTLAATLLHLDSETVWTLPDRPREPLANPTPAM